MTPRDSSDAEIEALDALCARLAGFDERVSLEWLDGCMAGLRAGPRAPWPDEWLATLLGDAWERTFADPQDQQQAMATLLGRWQVIDSQLDAQALFDDPDELRLSPLMTEYAIDELVAEGKLSPEEAVDWPRLGEVWALGVLEVIDTFAADWVDPAPDSEDAAWYDGCLRAIEALTLRDDAALQADLQLRYPGRTLSREDLMNEACIAVQDLRCYWVEHAPRHAPRRVVPTPGRNDPCPCGSGKKFKKCHGAAQAAQ
ncbi:MAG TPA: UPF0149 family protein [Rubrivivax sp.]|nr:UPF0149 family protein [Rubrivivax sp.]